MIKQMGYAESDITIAFRKDFTERDISVLLDNSTVER